MACGVLAFLELLQVLSPERNLACQPVERISCESLAGRPQGLHVSSGIGTESSNQHRTVLEAAAHKPAGEAGQRMNSVSRSGRRANSQPPRTTLQLQQPLLPLCKLKPAVFVHSRGISTLIGFSTLNWFLNFDRRDYAGAQSTGKNYAGLLRYSPVAL